VWHDSRVRTASGSLSTGADVLLLFGDCKSLDVEPQRYVIMEGTRRPSLAVGCLGLKGSRSGPAAFSVGFS